MQEHKVVLTWEAIYDLVDIIEYIEKDFGKARADSFQEKIMEQLKLLGNMAEAFGKTQMLYRNYSIYKKPFSPSIIFYVIDKVNEEVHILRILREEHDWKSFFSSSQKYTYPEK